MRFAPARRLIGGVCCGVLVCCAAACSKPPAPTPDNNTTATPPPKTTGEKPPERDAFGLPLPPRVHSISRRPDEVHADTRMTEVQAERFLKEALKDRDYEVIRTGWLTRAIPLRPLMPEVSATYPVSPRGLMRFTYRRARQVPHVVENGVARTKTKQEIREERDRYNKSIQKGMPVTLRTKDGRMLAPGAKWGEPYWPPEGSPLHTNEYKDNWGKPFGEWIDP